jgi:hypothetical protein
MKWTARPGTITTKEEESVSFVAPVAPPSLERPTLNPQPLQYFKAILYGWQATAIPGLSGPWAWWRHIGWHPRDP